jgi:hypothetical protein
MSPVIPGAEPRRLVWAWHVAGTGGRCRLLWKLDDVRARIWAESHELDLERIDGSGELRTVRQAPAQARRFPRR